MAGGAAGPSRTAEDRWPPDATRIAAAAAAAIGDPVFAECHARGRGVEPSVAAVREAAAPVLQPVAVRPSA